jgi:hypothetical protein
VQEPKSEFTLASLLLNLGGGPILTAAAIMIGFYFTTNADIKQLNQKLETAGKTISDKTADDTAQREKIRDAFLSLQAKTNEGIGKLDTRLAVAEQQQKTANEALTKISETLTKISSFPQARGR